MDPTNAVVKLCADGVAAESEARNEDAKRLFAQAWSSSRDDFESCIAAHYIARHQPTIEEELRWNEEALRRADLVADERVHTFYPSLYLNVAHSLERLGRTAEARRHYSLAAARLTDQPASPYTNLVRMGIEAGRRRVGEEGEGG